MGVVRGTRGRYYGQGFDGLRTWATRQGLLQEAYRNLKRLLIDLIMMGVYHSELQIVTHNAALILTHCIIPDALLTDYERGVEMHEIVLPMLLRGYNDLVN